MGLSCKPNIYVSWFTSELRLRLVLWNRFNPLVNYFYWPFQGGASFVEHLCYLCLVFVILCSLLPSGHLLRKRWLLCSRLWCLIVFCHFPMWYPGTGVVLDFIDSLIFATVLIYFNIIILNNKVCFHDMKKLSLRLGWVNNSSRQTCCLYVYDRYFKSWKHKELFSICLWTSHF